MTWSEHHASWKTLHFSLANFQAEML